MADTERDYDAVRQRCDDKFKVRRDEWLTQKEALAVAEEMDRDVRHKLLAAE